MAYKTYLTNRELTRRRLLITTSTHIEYIKLFMKYESEDMPIVYFYEVDLDDNRFCCRAIEIFASRRVHLICNLYGNVIETVPIPTKEEFNANIWGSGFRAFVVSQSEFEKVWESGIYNGNLASS